MAAFTGWAEEYDTQLHQVQFGHSRAAVFEDIGRAVYGWLADKGLADAVLDDAGEGPRVLTLTATPAQDGDLARAFLDVPWEVLTTPDHGPLAYNPTRPLEVARRLRPAGLPGPAPDHGDLRLLFMAAAPRGPKALDFEAEETSIAEATDHAVHLLVEETGALDQLGARLIQDHPVEVVHLSCHGDITEDGIAFLCLEDSFGRLAPATAKGIAKVLGKDWPPLLFLSACRTAEQGHAGAPLAIDLIEADAPVVLGWDGSVQDRDASIFARVFYEHLAQGIPSARAAAHARSELLRLLKDKDGEEGGQHWHLARVWLGPSGGEPLCRPGAPLRPTLKPAAYGKAFMGNVEVAPYGVFVGRRRPVQRVLRFLKKPAAEAGLLVLGTGRLGKSSLVARVLHSFGAHEPVVVHGNYEAESILEQVLKAVSPDSVERLKDHWLPELVDHPERLKDALIHLLTGAPPEKPVILVIDDLESALAPLVTGEGGVPAKTDALRETLTAVIAAFDDPRVRTTPARLLFTSRYRPALPGPDGDWAEKLRIEPLEHMTEREQQKLTRAEQRKVGQGDTVPPKDLATLLTRAVRASGGNPGLQARLSRPVWTEPAVADRAIEAVETYLETGTVPDTEDIGTFFNTLALKTYRAVLSDDQGSQMQACATFQHGVPLAVMHLAGASVGVAGPEAALDRLRALGLLTGPEDEVILDRLARPLFPLFEAEEKRTSIARACVAAVAKAWSDEDGDVFADRRSWELADMACRAGEGAEEIFLRAAEGAVFFGHRTQMGEDVGTGVALLKEALRPGEGRDQALSPSPNALLWALTYAQRIGDSQAVDLFNDSSKTLPSLDDRTAALFAGVRADVLYARGDLDEALRIRREVELPVYVRLGDVRSAAVIQGQIADVLYARGDLDEALRIRREVILPVFERLGEVEQATVVQGQIADVFAARGDLDEALRIRREVQLPVFERLGDVRSAAVTQGKIADVLEARGDLDEALRIRREVQLPVSERLGDVRSAAVTHGKIADVLSVRGDLDEALRTYREVILPVFERLGDVHLEVVTQGKIADVLAARGDLDEALRTYREVILPVFERLGDVRSTAVTQGKIAGVFAARGDLDEALRIRREVELPVFERLGDVRSAAVTQGKIADVLLARGDLDEALRIRREVELPVFERLGDVREAAVTQGKIADGLEALGDFDEALRIRREDEFPVYQRLRDVHSAALTQGKIALAFLRKGIKTQEDFDTFSSNLLASYYALRRLTDAHGISFFGPIVADFLAQFGQLQDALTIWDEVIAVNTVMRDEPARAKAQAQRDALAARIAAAEAD